ncbi:hypothetical protein N7475_003613 [Penicillium sp. IBT 31633x]|nr:hypothetical protein N7475_003613 [Penicillium sp. IBT 31633x]
MTMWAGTRLICIGDYLNADDLPATIQQDNLHLISAESDATSKPLRYDVVEEEFELWSYEEEDIAGRGYLAEGVWAGHKFDVVDSDTLENMDGQWEDVTEDICDEIQVLWSSDFGYNWETEWRA